MRLGYVVIINSPTISPELSSKEKVREGNDDQKDSKVEKFAHEKLPKVNVVVMHDTYEERIELIQLWSSLFLETNIRVNLILELLVSIPPNKRNWPPRKKSVKEMMTRRTTKLRSSHMTNCQK